MFAFSNFIPLPTKTFKSGFILIFMQFCMKLLNFLIAVAPQVPRIPILFYFIGGDTLGLYYCFYNMDTWKVSLLSNFWYFCGHQLLLIEMHFSLLNINTEHVCTLITSGTFPGSRIFHRGTVHCQKNTNSIFDAYGTTEPILIWTNLT